MPGRWLPAAARVCHPPAATLACRGPWKGTAGLESRPSPPYSGQQGLILEEAVEGEESSNRRVPGQTRLAFWGGGGSIIAPSQLPSPRVRVSTDTSHIIAPWLGGQAQVRQARLSRQAQQAQRRAAIATAAGRAGLLLIPHAAPLCFSTGSYTPGIQAAAGGRA